MTRWLAALPFLVVVLGGGLFAWQLLTGVERGFERESRAVPTRDFAALGGGTLDFSQLAADGPVAVNLFASWCSPCRAEHPLLMELSARHPGRLYGVLYKDNIVQGEAFLRELGNPFAGVALDPFGQGGIDFGLTGVPETFIIEDGEITAHYRGMLGPEDARAISAALAADPPPSPSPLPAPAS